jgi:hypothetical protein
VNHFPIYEPSTERIAEIAEAHSDANNPLNVHYDASQEVRAKGAGFYQFSGDEETRHQQMEELKSARKETEKKREETGAMDLRSGEVIGMRDEEATISKSRAMEKRKRDIEERRKLIEAKRRRVGGGAAIGDVGVDQRVVMAASGVSATPDPFLALEVQAKTDNKGKARASPTDNSADTFLAQLERDLVAEKAGRSS